MNHSSFLHAPLLAAITHFGKPLENASTKYMNPLKLTCRWLVGTVIPRHRGRDCDPKTKASLHETQTHRSVVTLSLCAAFSKRRPNLNWKKRTPPQTLRANPYCLLCLANLTSNLAQHQLIFPNIYLHTIIYTSRIDYTYKLEVVSSRWTWGLPTLPYQPNVYSNQRLQWDYFIQPYLE